MQDHDPKICTRSRSKAICEIKVKRGVQDHGQKRCAR